MVPRNNYSSNMDPHDKYKNKTRYGDKGRLE